MAGGTERGGLPLGRRIAPPRFLLFIALFAATGLGWHLLAGGKTADSIAIGFDLAALVFLSSLLPLLRERDAETIRNEARRNDANRVLVLVVASVIVLAVLAAISGELPEAGKGSVPSLLRLLATITLAWLFSNVVFALHYAHLYYGETDGAARADRGGLEFPKCPHPDYGDFLYFSATLGMTFQTSDVQICSRKMRRVVLAQSLAAFVFNLGIIGLVINGLGGLVG